MAPINRFIVAFLIPALIVDPALAGVFASARQSPSLAESCSVQSALFTDQAFMPRIVDMIRPLGRFMAPRGAMTEVAELAGLPEGFRAHRFPKIIKGRESWPVFERNLMASGLSESEARQVLEQGAFWIDSDGQLHEQPQKIQEVLAQGLSELLNRSVSSVDLRKAIIPGEEAIHQKISVHEAALIGYRIRDAVGEEQFLDILKGVGRMYGYHGAVARQILTDELLGKVHLENRLGNPLRLLSASGDVIELPSPVARLILNSLTSALGRILLPGPAPSEMAMETVARYYRTKTELRDAFIGGQGERYRKAYQALQKIERDTAQLLEQEGGRQALLAAAQVVQHSHEFKDAYGDGPTEEIIYVANRDLPAATRKMIVESADWITRLAIDLPSERKETAEQLALNSESFCLSRLIPSDIPDGQPSELEVESFDSTLDYPAAMPRLQVGAMVFSRPDSPHGLALLINPELDADQLRPTWRHEAIHYLAHLGKLPIASSNEVVTSMVDGMDLARTAGPQRLKRLGDGTQGALFERGRQLFREGGSIVDLQELWNVAREAVQKHGESVIDRDTETEKRQAKKLHEKMSKTATVGIQSTIERFLGYLVDGYLWEKELAVETATQRVFALHPRAEAQIIDHDALDRDIFAYMRQVVALEMPRDLTPSELVMAQDRLHSLFERANLLVSLTNDASVRAEPWQPLWPGDQPAWRYLLDQETGRPLHVFQYVPEDLIRRDAKSLRGFVYNQIFRALYSFQVLPESLKQDVHLWALWNQLEPIRVLPDGLDRWRGVQPAIEQAYDDRFALAHDPEMKRRFAEMPPYLQFLEASAYEAWQEEPDPRVQRTDVTAALENTREARERAVAAASAEAHVQILQAEVMPHLGALIEESRKELLEQQKMAEQFGRTATSLSQLTPSQRQALEQAVQNFLDSLSPQQQEQLQKALERQLEQMEQQQAQGNGSAPLPNALQPLKGQGKMQLPRPGHEQIEQKQSGEPMQAGDVASHARTAGHKAGDLAEKSGELAQMARQAREAAGQVAQGADQLKDQADVSKDLSEAAGALAKEAAKLSNELTDLQQEAQAADREGASLSRASQRLEQQAGGEAQDLAEQARRLGSRLANLRAKAEAALQQQAQPLQAQVEMLQQHILNKDPEAATPDRVRQQAHQARQQAQRLEQSLENLAESARQAEALAEKTAHAAEHLSQENTSPSQDAGDSEGVSEQTPVPTLPDSPTERLQSASAAPIEITGQELIRAIPEPPPSLTQLKPRDVPRENTSEATPPAPEPPKEDPAALRKAAEAMKADLDAAQRARAGLTAAQEKMAQDYLKPVQPHIRLIRTFFGQLFEPIYEVLREHRQRRGRIERRHLPKAVIEDKPRIRSRPGTPAIPRVRWSLLADISYSMLENQSGRFSKTLRDKLNANENLEHSDIEATKLEYANQAVAVVQEALTDGHGQNLPGHDSEIVAFTDADHLPKTGGWAVLKTFRERWTRKKMVTVLDQLLNLPHGGTDDVTAIVSTLERGIGEPYDRHIVIVMTDGQSGQELDQKIAGIREKYPKAKIFGVGIGRAAQSVETTFAPLGITVKDISELPRAVREIMGKEMKEVVDQWSKNRSRLSLQNLPWRWLFIGFGLIGIGLGGWLAWPLLDAHFHAHPREWSGLLTAVSFAIGAAVKKQSRSRGDWAEDAAQELQSFIEKHPDDRRAQMDTLYELYTKNLPGPRFVGKGGPRVPDVEIYALPQNLQDLQNMELIARSEEFPFIYLWGPHGSGKNYKLDLWAASRNQGLTLLPAHEDMEEDEIFERQVLKRVPDPRGGAPVTSSEWELTEFAHALVRGDIVAWDEFREMPDKVRAKMNRAMQAGFYERKNGDIVTFNKDAKIVALSNPDDGMISGEMVDRFTHLQVSYLPPDQEMNFLRERAPSLPDTMIEGLVNVATEIRKARSQGIDLDPISTRELMMVVQHLERFEQDRKRVPHVFRQVYLPPDDMKPELLTKVDEWLRDTGKFIDEEPPPLTVKDWEIKDNVVGTGSLARTETVLRIGDVECPIYGADKHVVGQAIKEYEKLPTNLRMLQDLMKAVMLRQHVLIEGDMGTGKDWMLDVLFHALQWPVYTEDMNQGTLADDLIGWDELRENTQVWQWGKVAQAAANDGIVYLGEVNRSRKGTQASIHNFLQTKYAKLSNGLDIDARDKEHFVVIVSANPNRLPYHTFPMGVAFRSRLKKFRVNYLPFQEGVHEEEVDLLQGFRPSIPRQVLIKVVKAANKLRDQYRQSLGVDVPLAVTPRTLKKWAHVLAGNPALYAGDLAVQWFLNCYGISALPQDIQAVVQATIEGVLKHTDVGLDHIEQYQPIAVGDVEFDGLIGNLRGATGASAERAAKAISDAIYARRFHDEPLPLALPSTLDLLIARTGPAAAKSALQDSKRWTDPSQSVVTGARPLDEQLMKILALPADTPSDRETRLRLGKEWVQQHMKERLKGDYFPKPARLDKELDRLRTQEVPLNPVTDALQHIYDDWVQPKTGDSYLDIGLEGLLDLEYQDSSTENLEALLDYVPKWLAQNRPPKAAIKNLLEVLKWLETFTLASTDVQARVHEAIAQIEAGRTEPGQDTRTMADRLGARRTAQSARRPMIRGEAAQTEFESIKKDLAQRYPALQDAFARITRVRYAPAVSLNGAATLQPRADQPDQLEMIVDERYRGFDATLRQLFLKLHLAHEAAELHLTPSDQPLQTEMNREMAALLLQANLYFSLSDQERGALLAAAVALDKQEPNDLDRFAPVLEFYANAKSFQNLTSSAYRSQLLEFMAVYPDVDANAYDAMVVEQHLADLLPPPKAFTREEILAALRAGTMPLLKALDSLRPTESKLQAIPAKENPALPDEEALSLLGKILVPTHKTRAIEPTSFNDRKTKVDFHWGSQKGSKPRELIHIYLPAELKGQGAIKILDDVLLAWDKEDPLTTNSHLEAITRLRLKRYELAKQQGWTDGVLARAGGLGKDLLERYPAPTDENGIAVLSEVTGWTELDVRTIHYWGESGEPIDKFERVILHIQTAYTAMDQSLNSLSRLLLAWQDRKLAPRKPSAKSDETEPSDNKSNLADQASVTPLLNPYELRDHLVSLGWDPNVLNRSGLAINHSRGIFAATDSGLRTIRFFDIRDPVHINLISAWDIETLWRKGTIQPSNVYGLGFSDDGMILALYRGDQIYELRDLKDIASPQFIKAVEYHSVGSPDHLEFWDAQDSQQPFTLTSNERSALADVMHRSVADQLPPAVDAERSSAGILKDVLEIIDGLRWEYKQEVWHFGPHVIPDSTLTDPIDQALVLLIQALYRLEPFGVVAAKAAGEVTTAIETILSETAEIPSRAEMQELSPKVAESELPTVFRNVLGKANIEEFSQLSSMSEAAVMRLTGSARACLNAIMEALDRRGLSLLASRYPYGKWLTEMKPYQLPESYKALQKGGIRTWGQLARISKEDLKIKYLISDQGIVEIERQLQKRGLPLGIPEIILIKPVVELALTPRVRNLLQTVPTLGDILMLTKLDYQTRYRLGPAGISDLSNAVMKVMESEEMQAILQDRQDRENLFRWGAISDKPLAGELPPKFIQSVDWPDSPVAQKQGETETLFDELKLSFRREDVPASIEHSSINDVEVSVRLWNILKNNNLQTIGPILDKTEAEMLRLPNMGRKPLNELREVLKGIFADYINRRELIHKTYYLTNSNAFLSAGLQPDGSWRVYMHDVQGNEAITMSLSYNKTERELLYQVDHSHGPDQVFDEWHTVIREQGNLTNIPEEAVRIQFDGNIVTIFLPAELIEQLRQQGKTVHVTEQGDQTQEGMSTFEGGWEARIRIVPPELQPFISMADRLGARRTPSPERGPLIKGEVDSQEFDAIKQELGDRYPALRESLSRITRVRYAAPVSMHSAATLRARPDQPGEWEMIVDERYRGLDPVVRNAFLKLHLVHEAAELHLTPAGHPLQTEINREIAALLVQGNLYVSLSDEERGALLAAAQAIDKEEPYEADRFAPVLQFYAQAQTFKNLRSFAHRPQLLEFMSVYPDVDPKAYQRVTTEKHLEELLSSSPKQAKQANSNIGGNVGQTPAPLTSTPPVDPKTLQALQHAAEELINDTWGSYLVPEIARAAGILAGTAKRDELLRIAWSTVANVPLPRDHYYLGAQLSIIKALIADGEIAQALQWLNTHFSQRAYDLERFADVASHLPLSSNAESYVQELSDASLTILNDVDTRFRVQSSIALIYAKWNDQMKAKQALEAALSTADEISKTEERLKALFRVARIYAIDLHDRDAAIQVLENNALETADEISDLSERAKAQSAIATEAVSMKDFSKAAEFAVKALGSAHGEQSSEHERFRALLAVAKAFLDSGQAAEAISIADEANQIQCQRTFDDAESLASLGLVSNAIEILEAKTDPNAFAHKYVDESSVIYLDAADAFIRFGDLTRGYDNLKKALNNSRRIRYEDTRSNRFMNIARVAGRLQNPEHAAELLDWILTEVPGLGGGNEAAHVLVVVAAQCPKLAANPAKATELLRKTYRLAKRQQTVFGLLETSYSALALGDTRLADESLQKATVLAQTDRSAIALAESAREYCRRGNIQIAAELLGQATGIYERIPSDWQIKHEAREAIREGYMELTQAIARLKNTKGSNATDQPGTSVGQTPEMQFSLPAANHELTLMALIMIPLASASPLLLRIPGLLKVYATLTHWFIIHPVFSIVASIGITVLADGMLFQNEIRSFFTKNRHASPLLERMA